MSDDIEQKCLRKKNELLNCIEYIQKVTMLDFFSHEKCFEVDQENDWEWQVSITEAPRGIREMSPKDVSTFVEIKFLFGVQSLTSTYIL